MKTLLALLLLIPSLSWGNHNLIEYKNWEHNNDTGKSNLQFYLEDGYKVEFYDSHLVPKDGMYYLFEIFILNKKKEIITCYKNSQGYDGDTPKWFDFNCYPSNSQLLTEEQYNDVLDTLTK